MHCIDVEIELLKSVFIHTALCEGIHIAPKGTNAWIIDWTV